MLIIIINTWKYLFILIIISVSDILYMKTKVVNDWNRPQIDGIPTGNFSIGYGRALTGNIDNISHFRFWYRPHNYVVFTVLYLIQSIIYRVLDKQTNKRTNKQKIPLGAKSPCSLSSANTSFNSTGEIITPLTVRQYLSISRTKKC